MQGVDSGNVFETVETTLVIIWLTNDWIDTRIMASDLKVDKKKKKKTVNDRLNIFEI